MRAIDMTIFLDKLLDYPHKSYPIIYVSGTNGKGSTSSMLASILIESGYKVGTFNTPFIHSKMDTIKINGTPISNKKFSANLKKLAELIKNEKYFNFSSLLIENAFLYFKENDVDVAIIETDLGAATDSTGVVEPIVSLLTNITEDHLDRFNGSLIDYATEKSGVIKPNTPIYIGETPSNDEIKEILYNKAKECNTVLTFTDTDENNLIQQYNGFGNYDTVFGSFTMSLGGDYQKHNLNLVLNTVKELKKQGYNISNDNVVSGLCKIYENTGLCGRWQILNSKPLIILDCGHNINAWEKTIPQLMGMNYKNLHIVFQMCKDKNTEKICKILPDKDNITYWFPLNMHERLENPESIMKKTNWMKLSKRNKNMHLIKILKTLYNTVNEDDAIFISGTCKNIHSVLDFHEHFNKLILQ